jgi:hypothetical protein
VNLLSLGERDAGPFRPLISKAPVPSLDLLEFVQLDITVDSEELVHAMRRLCAAPSESVNRPCRPRAVWPDEPKLRGCGTFLYGPERREWASEDMGLVLQKKLPGPSIEVSRTLIGDALPACPLAPNNLFRRSGRTGRL